MPGNYPPEECTIEKNKKNSRRIQNQLEKEKEILDNRIEDPGIPSEEAVQPARSKVTWRFNQKLRRALLSARASLKKKEVETALEHLEEGKYGTCINCGKEINPKRLEVMPTTVLCYECSHKGVEVEDVKEEE
jgi:RNA polymerase-binding transcription factor DksA